MAVPFASNVISELVAACGTVQVKSAGSVVCLNNFSGGTERLDAFLMSVWLGAPVRHM